MSLSVRICTLFATHLTSLLHPIAYSTPFLSHSSNRPLLWQVYWPQPFPLAHCLLASLSLRPTAQNRKKTCQGHWPSLVPLGLVILVFLDVSFFDFGHYCPFLGMGYVFVIDFFWVMVFIWWNSFPLAWNGGLQNRRFPLFVSIFYALVINHVVLIFVEGIAIKVGKYIEYWK